MILIDKKYDKAQYKIGTGWDKRTVSPKSIIIHTTNGKENSSFEQEALYISRSRIIGAHYLEDKKGQILQILDPHLRAWHAGAVRDQRFNNNNSIGIEVHYTPGEGVWNPAMHHGLTWLVMKLVQEFNIQNPSLIETHRNVAIPKGRKIDPSGFDDEAFYQWRDSLFTFKDISFTRYMAIDAANIRQQPGKYANNIAGTLEKGAVILSSVIKVDELGENIAGINTWAHVTQGESRGKRIDGLGFVHTSLLRIIG